MTQTTFTARLSHHSISRTPVHTLKAKTGSRATAEASRLLGDGFRDHTIIVERNGEPFASRKLSQRLWSYYA